MEKEKNVELGVDISKGILDEALKKLPPIPAVLSKLIHMFEQPSASASTIAEELAKDPVLASDVLRVVNSPLYGFEKQILSLEHAVVILGADAITRLVIAAWAKKIQEVELKGYMQERGALAYQSMLGGYAARKVAETAALTFLTDVIFTAAVIRNIGKVALDAVVFSKINEVMKEVRAGKAFDRAEKSVFGVNHAEVGYILVERWSFPRELSLTIKHFHRPSEFKGNERILKIVSCVHVGDRIATLVGEGTGIDGMLYSIDSVALRVLNIGEENIEKIFVETVLVADKVKEEFF